MHTQGAIPLMDAQGACFLVHTQGACFLVHTGTLLSGAHTGSHPAHGCTRSLLSGAHMEPAFWCTQGAIPPMDVGRVGGWVLMLATTGTWLNQSITLQKNQTTH